MFELLQRLARLPRAWFDSPRRMPIDRSHQAPATGSSRSSGSSARARLIALPLTVLLAAALAIGGGLLLGAQRTLPGAPASPTPTTAGEIGAPTVDVTPTPRPSATPTARPTASAPPTPEPTPDGPTSLPPEELRGFVWPLRKARITSRFGPRTDGLIVINGERVHDGIDLATWCGDRIRAAHDGVVLYAGRKFDEHVGYSDTLDRFYARLDRIGGLKLLPIVVVIDYGNGYRGAYAHLSRSDVEAGDVVQAGQVIGREGATGRATGCHLHYSLVRMDGTWLEVAPSLVESLHYPSLIRERVDPLLVFPLGDQYAPPRLRQRYGPKPAPTPDRTEPILRRHATGIV